MPGLAYRPFEGLYKSQIRLLGRELAIPAQVLERRPTLDAYPGQSDESELGAPYEAIDAALTWLLDQKGTKAQAVAKGLSSELLDRVSARLERRVGEAGAVGID